MLLNYSAQLTLTELNAKLERLNELTAAEPGQIKDVINLLSDILGQLHGNKALRIECKDLIDEISTYTEKGKKLSEARKRTLVSKIRERLRDVSFEKYGEMTGD